LGYRYFVLSDFGLKLPTSVFFIVSLQPPEAKDSSAPPPKNKTKERAIVKRGQEPLRQALFRMSGFDLTSIDGIGVDSAAIHLSELGTGFSRFEDEGHFFTYLRLAPNISNSGGKKIPGKLKVTTCTRVCDTLRMAATSLRNTKIALDAYYRRISYRKAAAVEVFSTAHKLAKLIYRLVRYGQAYIDKGVDVD
jgi:transposase